MTLVKWLWAREPVVMTIVTSAGFWPALFYLLAAFGHPLTAMQQEALGGLGVIIAGGIIRGQVSPTSGATAPPAVSNATRSSLTVLALCAVLGAGVLVSSCATFRALPINDQVYLELDAAEWGVKADHDFSVNWLSDADVAVFNHIDDTIRQVLATNPPNAKAAARAAALVELAKLPADSKLRPYVDGFARALA